MARKQRKCKQCKRWFTPFNTLQKTCPTPACAIEEGKRLREKERRKETLERKRALKTRSDVLKEAQAAFNAYIRQRDRFEACVSCGRMPDDSTLITGSFWHASHYRSVGACSSLRFDEDNVHAACSTCNSHKSGNILEYRIGLVKKIGIERVERLESAPKLYRWTKEEALEIRDRYRRKKRELEKQHGDS